ncbi:medium chain reductase/dehydrogenase ucsI-like [Ischnura elegans]|uniref:medium chain reductase/dehydrogenase ucsI-like n=1 Tax=Ischnura elegans TaxID=197161 RepID=UPI001ED8A7CD|nr:medium chain reductase/dehydrogenase ucsI-like [Ischnura elegans]XP_046402096.1 medium chain reductase/dehydrogenase ucsI-like [Ischnura elegans]
MVQQPPLPTQATCLLFVGAARRPSFVVENCRVRLKELAPSEVLVRVRLAGLCASDVRRFISEDAHDECALVPGHEAVGDVIASRRPGIEVGVRVVFSSSNWCSTCEWCRRGAHVACENVTKYGHPPLASLSESELGGTLSSHVLLRAGTAVCPVPTSVSDGHALLASCALATVLAGVLRLTTCHMPMLLLDRNKMAGEDAAATAESAEGESRTKPTALVQGCGLVGVLACAVLSEMGFRVFCEDFNVSRLRLASKFHAQPVFREAGPLTPSASLPERVDAVVVAIGSRLDYSDPYPSPPLLQGQLLRPGGALLLLGQPRYSAFGKGATLEAADIYGRDLCVIGASEYEPDHLKDAVQFLESTEGKFPYSELLSPVYPLSDFQNALTSALERKFLRVVVRPMY